MSTVRPIAAVFVSTLLLGACAKKGSEAETTSPEPMASSGETTVVAEPAPPPLAPEPEPAIAQPTEPVAAPAPLTDAQITAVLQAVDTAEVEQAKIAQKKGKDKRVKQYAQQMVQHHTKSKQKGTTLAKKEQIQPEQSPVATQLTDKATQLTESLKNADPTTFDALYIEGQAQQHQEVLDLVNAQLIPSAQSNELKSLLAEMRTMVEKHVTEARTLHAAITNSGTSGASGDPATGGAGGTSSTTDVGGSTRTP